MKIALAHEMLVKLGGAERVVKTLTDLFPKAPLYTLLHDEKTTDDWFEKTNVKTSELQKWAKRGVPHRFLLPFMPKATEQLDFNHYDTVISSSSAFMHGIKTAKKTKHICYVHSPMRYAWDYTHRYMENYSPLMRYLISRELHRIRQWDFHTASNPDLLIANSEHVRKRINKYWRKDAQVIYPPVDVKRFTPTKNHEDYFLIVSALTPFKRIDLAIKTFNKIKRRLIIIGEGAQKKALQSMAGETIEFKDYQNDHSVRDYLEHCRAFIFPGEEDFGITPVEAMAAGKPVLAYGVGGVTESVQPGISGEFFYEPTPQSLENGLTTLIINEKNYDEKKIRAIAEKFSKEIFVEKMQKIIQ